MSDTRVGLSFHEVMSGPVALELTDPGAAAHSPTVADLVMRGHVTIPDMDVFIESPRHRARLDVRFDFPPWGTDLDGSGGTFNLFIAGDRPNAKLMVYEWPATHEGAPYYFAGKKRVVHDSPLDLWKDTTTLYLEVHRGTDASGPVVGAGIIGLSVAGLVHMIGTFEALDPQTSADRLRVVSEFGKFFLGELWNSYGPHGGQ
jgi:choline dehydrogenase-like flavoprotein